MLQNIIKRNGEIEPFDARKFSAWAEWANKDLPNVNMNLIVINAINKIKQDKITSDQLQNVLIDACVETDKESEQYNIMAGRLHVASAIKKIHKDELPHLRNHVLNLINEKVLVANDYTEEEYNQLQDIIDHDRSYNYPYYQSKYLISKYSLQNRITNQKYETPQFTYMRMAMALVDKKYYPNSEDRIKAVKRFYDHFSLNKLNAPSPAYFNLGTSHKGYNSCLLYKAGDSIDSLNIGNSITFKFTALSAGIGGNIDCRSMGDPIRHGAVKHSGKNGYYRSTESNVHANVQGGRGGSATMYYNSFDPDSKSITMAQSIKTPSDNRIRGIHFAALHNRFLAEQVMQDKDIMHFNCFTAPDLNDKLYSSDYEGFKELYNKYLHDEKFPKKFSNALDLTVNQLQQSLEVGTLYHAFIDEMNRHTPFKETIHSSNLCVGPDTYILTKELGNVKISTVVNQTLTVWNGNNWSSVEIKKTGEKQKLYKVNTSNFNEIYLTPYHKWYIQSNSGIIEKITDTLEIGDKIIKFNLDKVIHGTQVLSSAYDLGKTLFSPNNSDFITIPNNKFDIVSRVNFIAGVLDTIGFIVDEGNYKGFKLSHENIKSINQLKLMLIELGIFSNITYNTISKKYDLLINSYYSKTLVWSLNLKTKILPYSQITSTSVIKSHDDIIVTEIDKTNVSYQDTYCFTEPLENKGMFNGIILGNCVEITQPTKEYNSELDLFLQEDHGRGEVSMCSLGAINVSIEMTDEEYLDVAKSALEMVDYFIDNSTYAYPHIEYTVKNRRNAAIGMVGVATVMARKNLSYDSVEGRNELFLLAERHAYFLTLASLQLGIERGNAPWMHKTKWPEGWTYAKSYNKNVNKLITVKFKYDWDALSKRIIANGGIRNSCLISHMPTESSSKGSGAPNGVYPIREINLLKTDDNNAVEWVAKESDILKERYQKAYSIDNVDLIKAYSVIQAWTDGSISADLYVDRSIDIKVNASQLIKEYLTMQKYGLKTRYYYNTKAAKAKFTAKRNRDIPMEVTKERGCAGGACDV